MTSCMNMLGAFVLLAGSTVGQGDFVNWETPHVHPLERTPDGDTLLAVNLPDARLELFDLASGGPVPIHLASIPVGLDPLAVRARTNQEVWVVNHVSDSISIIDLDTRHVRATLATDDEPTDVIFAGIPERAFVSCSQENTILVFDPSDLSVAPQRIEIAGEEPRALATSADGLRVYCAIFESGNRTTVLGNGDVQPGDYPPDVVGISSGPYGGISPPPNDMGGFNPPLNPILPTPPETSLIVKQSNAGPWLDDNGTDWSVLVDGMFALSSGRFPGWGLQDNDLAVIDTMTLDVTYANHAMNVCMDLAVHPISGEITLVGTDAINEVRFEPILNGVFLRVNLARIDPVTLAPTVSDLNPHLDYLQSTLAQNLRDQSVSDPRGIVWSADGTRAFVSGMGTNNVISIDATGTRIGAGAASVIEVGEGPTGLHLDEGRQRLYVMNKFETSLSIIDTSQNPPLEIDRIAFFDPSPTAIRNGRKHLYDARETSGLGVTSCAACHVDARMDRLAWDLGNPAGDMRPIGDLNAGAGIEGNGDDVEEFHPLKGPMLTQTLRDIIGKEPFHWRGDRDGLEEFNGAFEGLLGDDEGRTPTEMQEFEDFLATIYFPPNPFRNLDNSLPTSLDIEETSIGTLSPVGTPLPSGNAVAGKQIFRQSCGMCHTLPMGMGTAYAWDGSQFQAIPPGPNGEAHHSVRGPVGDGIPFNIKVPSLRNLYERRGSDNNVSDGLAGVGFRHDGTIDTLSRFIFRGALVALTEQQGADVIAFLLTISGESEVEETVDDPDLHPGSEGLWTHAMVGAQVTIDSPMPSAETLALLGLMNTLHDTGAIDLVIRARYANENRSGYRRASGVWQMDRASEATLFADHLARATTGRALTVMAVPSGSGRRLGVDRDRDGFLDRDEIDAGSDPDDPDSRPRRARASGGALPSVGATASNR